VPRATSVLDEVALLLLRQVQTEHPVVVVHDRTQSAALPSWKYGGCCSRLRSGVVRYFFVPDLDA
jgi:hypothetical protein